MRAATAGGERGWAGRSGDRWGRWLARSARGRRVIATFSNEDSRTTAQPLRNASPPEQRYRRCPTRAAWVVDTETEGGE